MGERLTKGDIEKIQAEIDERKFVIRPQAIEEVKVTRAQGDLSENFEYHEAKRFKNKNESRIRYLERLLKNAMVVDDSSADDEVGINNTVTVYFEEDDCEETYRIVTSIRGDSTRNLVSIESPIGQALIGKKMGDRVCVNVSADYSYYLQIRSIENTEDSDDLTIKEF
ncbi:MAG: transcription elongation factor GreA [Lachnospiraceae bacterium]|nr:transcription elongation factor GreA [Lachnospiraceae bacterium]